MIYLWVFLLSLLFFFISEKISTSAKGTYAAIYKKIFIFLGFLPPVWLGGMRSLTIGTDVRIYGISEFWFAERFEHFTMQLFVRTESSIEWGYRLINFIVSRFTDEIGWLLGTICLIIIVCVYLSLAGYKKYCNPEISITFGIFVFYTLFYNESYNLLRQTIAASIVLLSTQFIWKRQWWFFVVTILIATSFHITAFFCLILYPLYVFIVVKGKWKVSYVLCLIGGCVFFASPYIVNWTLRLDILPQKFMRYMIAGGIREISINQLIIRIPFIILAFVLINKVQRDELKNRYAFFAVLLVLDLLLAELRSTNTTLYRLSIYFSYPKVFIYTELTSRIKILGSRINWSKILVAMFLMSIWIYQIVIQGNGQTYPYIFR